MNEFLLKIYLGENPSYLNKTVFGFNPSADDSAFVQVWDGGGVLNSSDTANHYISSDSAEDTGNKIYVCGLDESGAEKKKTFELNGKNKVNIEVFSAIFKARAIESDVEGNIYIYEDCSVTDGVPDDSSKIRGKIIAGNQNTRTNYFKIPSNHSGVIYDFWISSPEQTEFEFEVMVKEDAKPEIIIFKGNHAGEYREYKVGHNEALPANTEIKVAVKKSNSTPAPISAGYKLLLGSG